MTKFVRGWFCFACLSFISLWGVKSEAIELNAKKLEKAQWQGMVMGADSSIEIYYLDADKRQDVGAALMTGALEEIERLEAIFSLYKENSEINRLNDQGYTLEASAELIEVIDYSMRMSQRTAGTFDITVQGLWNCYQEADCNGTDSASAYSYNDIQLEGRSIRFNKQGMKITLNALAVGYIADKVAAYFQQRGVEYGLIDIGEYRAIGTQENGDEWRIGLTHQGALLQVVSLGEGQGLSTSGGDLILRQQEHDEKMVHHIFNAKTGGSPHHYQMVTVVAQTAMAADAASTAFMNMLPQQIEEHRLKDEQIIKVYLLDKSGVLTILE